MVEGAGREVGDRARRDGRAQPIYDCPVQEASRPFQAGFAVGLALLSAGPGAAAWSTEPSTAVVQVDSPFQELPEEVAPPDLRVVLESTTWTEKNAEWILRLRLEQADGSPLDPGGVLGRSLAGSVLSADDGSGDGPGQMRGVRDPRCARGGGALDCS